MRSFLKWVSLGVLVVAFAGCSDGLDNGASGTLSSTLLVAPGEDITSVNYEITGPGGVDLTGTIPVTANPLTAIIGAIPVGTGYTITLTSPDGKCSGSATFDSVADKTSTATVKITCLNPRGAVNVTGTFTVCTTTIISVVASPAQVNVGETISVNATATDSGGATVTYGWTATNTAGAGSFADPAAATTTFKCTTAGGVTVTLNANCDQIKFDVTCGPAAACAAGVANCCGNGVVDTSIGEKCDTLITTGDGVCPTAATCTGGDACAPNTIVGTGCQAECKAVPITVAVCGDGCVTSPETCEPPNTATCDANCQTKACGSGVPNCCGNGVVDTSIGEKCDTAITTGDGVCPTAATCTGGDACAPNTIVGTDCLAECVAVPVAVAKCGDNCITSPETCDDGNTVSGDGCSSTCTIEPTCGDGKLDPATEKCDTGIKTGTGVCPTSCDAGADACNPITVQGTGCQAECKAVPITTCSTTKDGCCPTNCTAATDSDCSCSTITTCSGTTKDGCCPTNCTAATDSDCSCSTVTACSGTTKDGCCPAGCTNTTDADCPSGNVIYTYDFEAGLDDWYASNGIWQVGAPASTSGPGGAHSGTQCAATNLDGIYPKGPSILVSSTITLPTIAADQEIRLRFWHWFSFGTNDYWAGDDSDSGSVMIQTQTSPGVWSGWTSLTSYRGNGETWTYPLVDLSAYAGKTVHIGFSLNMGGTAKTGAGWFIDDITIAVGNTTVISPGGSYSYDFDAGWDDWSATNGLWQVGTPASTSGPGGAHSGMQCAATNLDGTYLKNPSTLVSPTITLPTIVAGQELELRFWHWFSFGTNDYWAGDDSDSGSVMIQTQTLPGVWSGWTTLTSYRGSCGGVWTYPLVDLSAYSGMTVHIGFSLNMGGTAVTGTGWFIDEVLIEIH